MNDPNRVPAPASCLVCQLANVYGCLSCRDTNCPNPLPDSEQAEQDALDAYCREELERIEAETEQDAFHIEDEKSANWYLRRPCFHRSRKSPHHGANRKDDRGTRIRCTGIEISL